MMSYTPIREKIVHLGVKDLVVIRRSDDVSHLE